MTIFIRLAKLPIIDRKLLVGTSVHQENNILPQTKVELLKKWQYR